jgi:hypothetical protein
MKGCKMKKSLKAKTSLVCPLCLLLLLAGCYINIGSCHLQSKYQRKVNLTAPLSPGSTFEAQTHNGFINISGSNAANCDLEAIITARATTEETAKQLAENTQIRLEPSGSKLIIKIDKPILTFNKSIDISFTATVPNQTNLELTTHNGAIKIENINGQLNCTTHNGKVTAKQVSGSSTLQTHNGSVICEEISGDAQLKTHNGSIKAYYRKDAPAICDISIVTHNGRIEISTPPNLSAKIEVSTHNGSIHTDLPITIIGKINKHNLTGTIGTGEGKLHLETHNGSITIKGMD